MSARVIIVDVETTSLTPDYETGSGVIWELAAIVRDTGAEHAWRMAPNLSVADPGALRVGQFYTRTKGTLTSYVPTVWDFAAPDLKGKSPYWSDPRELASSIARLLDDAIIVAANPTFDAGFLASFLRHYGQAPTWHYRLRDIGSMAWARLQAHHLPHHLPTPPIDASTDDLAMAMGIDPEDFERHSALGDCRLVAAMLDRIERGPVA
jgi:hypothetical protein